MCVAGLASLHPGCGGGTGADGGDGGDASDVSTAGDSGPVTGDAEACAEDPLHTGLTAQQTGVSVDVDDCAILQWTAAYGEPDAMIFKAIIYVESRFDYAATACPNLPCGTPEGWSADESYCYGVMQVVPACGPTPDSAGLLPDGHPNLTKDMKSALWDTSIFNPEVNIKIGVAGIAGNRAQVLAQFPGCTPEQYTLMAIGNYNSYGSTKSCTEINTEYVDIVLAAYDEYSAASGWPAQSYH